MGSLSIKFLKFFLKFLTFLFDLVTLPLYAVWQKPWIKLREDFEPKAQIINSKNGLTYRSLIPISPIHIILERNKIDTMEKVFAFGVARNGRKKCLGSREMIDEEDEIQPNNKRILKKFVMGKYMWKNYHQVDRLAHHLGRGLLELGLRPGQTLAIFAETRAEWLIAANAAFKQNLTIVTLYATLGEDAVVHGLNETEVTHVITSHQLLPKFWYILEKVRTLTHLIFMEDPLKITDTRGYRADVKIHSFCSVIDVGARSSKGTSPPSPNDIAIIMYTSGSTGVPKGVQLSHNNIVSGMMAFCDSLGPVHSTDVYIAFLPLAHVLEFMIEAICILFGVPIGYSSPLTMTEQSGKVKRGCKGDASLLRPTVMASVPLILDRIHKTIQAKIDSRSKWSQLIFTHFYHYKLKWFWRGYDTPLVNYFIFGKIKNILGGRVRIIISGGAPLSPDTQQFIRTALCCPLLQGYGLTETGACATCCLDVDRSLGRVGGTLGCCDIRLVDWEEGNYRLTDLPHPRGEILIGGDNVSVGYYKLPEDTKAEFFNQDGHRWFRSGDIGEIHPDGVLKIIDRKKDLVKLQNGEYLSLGKVESELKTCPLVDNICVYADSTKLFCVALIIPSIKNLQKLAQKHQRNDSSLQVMCRDSVLDTAVLKELICHGRKCGLQKFELPTASKLVSDIWSPEMGLVTAAFKLKRKNVQDKYQADIHRMYAMTVLPS